MKAQGSALEDAREFEGAAQGSARGGLCEALCWKQGRGVELEQRGFSSRPLFVFLLKGNCEKKTAQGSDLCAVVLGGNTSAVCCLCQGCFWRKAGKMDQLLEGRQSHLLLLLVE